MEDFGTDDSMLGRYNGRGDALSCSRHEKTISDAFVISSVVAEISKSSRLSLFKARSSLASISIHSKTPSRLRVGFGISVMR